MAKWRPKQAPSRSGKRWRQAEVAQLKVLVEVEEDWDVIASKLNRTENAVKLKWHLYCEEKRRERNRRSADSIDVPVTPAVFGERMMALRENAIMSNLKQTFSLPTQDLMRQIESYLVHLIDSRCHAMLIEHLKKKKRRT